jgi:2-haloacid dehalogenase
VIDFERFTHLSFDCYGTIVDWESGILTTLRRVLTRHLVEASDEELLRLYARFESEHEAGPFLPYHDILRLVMVSIAAELGFEPRDDELDELAGSLPGWPPFTDSVDSLRRLASRYGLVILSNVDDALFAETAKSLPGVEFHAVFTAEQIGSYKPAVRNFEVALEQLGVSTDRLLHVAQSLFHDHVPAKAVGLTTVWVNRASLLPGTGLSLSVEATPDLEVAELAGLVQAMSL